MYYEATWIKEMTRTYALCEMGKVCLKTSRKKDNKKDLKHRFPSIQMIDRS